MGEIGSSGHVWKFPDRCIREKHGRQHAFSRWVEVRIGSLILGCKFPSWIVEVQVLVVQPYLISNFAGGEVGVYVVLHEKGGFFVGSNGFFPSFRKKVEAFFQFEEVGLPNFEIGTGFVVHYEREESGIGDRMGVSIVREFCHRKEFGPFRRLVLGEDVEIGFKFLVYLFQFTISLRVIGGGKGNVIF